MNPKNGRAQEKKDSKDHQGGFDWKQNFMFIGVAENGLWASAVLCFSVLQKQKVIACDWLFIQIEDCMLWGNFEVGTVGFLVLVN